MSVPWGRWTVFVCHVCGWASAGCYETKTGLTTIPDTDCHECGSHDSVLDIEHEVVEPRRLDLVHKRLKSEWVK